MLAAGFAGPIYCTKASALLLPAVIEDALKIGVTKNSRLIKAVLNRIKTQIIELDYNKWQLLTGFDTSVKIKFKPAGHIIGSAYIEVICKNNSHKTKVTFSGDLGAPYTPLLPAPKAAYSCDILVLESTYGNKEHKGRAYRKTKLKEIIENSLQNGGCVLIPAFSIGRTQELLYELEEIIYQAKKQKNNKWGTLPIIVDSPMAANFTKLYKQLQPLWDKEAKRKLKKGRNPLSFKNLITIDSHNEHLALVNRLSQTNEPAIIIAASGMCSGGRIVSYLQAMLSKQTTDIIFVGYQGAGTPGRDIQKYGPSGGYVELEGERYNINAQVHTINGYSAHADQSDLVNFVKRMRHTPKEIYLVHGEAKAKQALASKLYNLAPQAKINV